MTPGAPPRRLTACERERLNVKIAALLSGGVDSSVALKLVVEAGHRDIKAFYLKIWLEDELAYLGNCPWEEDLKYARAVCEQAGVPLTVLSLQSEYHQRVVTAAVQELRVGRTPSPDIWCNQRIKFGLFFDKIDPGFDKLVSGHYAQVEDRDGVCLLKRSPTRSRTRPISCAPSIRDNCAGSGSRSGTCIRAMCGGWRASGNCPIATAKTARASVFWAR